MKTLPAGLQSLLDSGTTTLCWCWRISRDDGVVMGFTDHDEALTFDGTAFEPETGLIPSEIRSNTDLAVDAQDGEGVLQSDRITETDILDGRWDNAVVEVWRVNWQNAAERVLLRSGAIGQIRRGRLAFVAEMRSLSHVLGQAVGRLFQGTCDAELGDDRCKVNLEDPAYKGSGSVSDVLRDRAFAASGLSDFDAGWFALGELTWSTGANAGRSAEVMMHEISGGSVVLTLLEAPVRGIEVGDTFAVYAGCDKRGKTCSAKFANIYNFRGFETIPGQDAIIRYATKDGGNQGNPL